MRLSFFLFFCCCCSQPAIVEEERERKTREKTRESEKGEKEQRVRERGGEYQEGCMSREQTPLPHAIECDPSLFNVAMQTDRRITPV